MSAEATPSTVWKVVGPALTGPSRGVNLPHPPAEGSAWTAALLMPEAGLWIAVAAFPLFQGLVT